MNQRLFALESEQYPINPIVPPLPGLPNFHAKIIRSSVCKSFRGLIERGGFSREAAASA
ncbi:MAG: hypothetical protein WD768_16265 [Phycisphaeraceae bacterium]